MAYTPGIDVSHWQGNIDWQAVGAAGQCFAFIKATDGTTFVDPDLAVNWKNAKDAGLVRGAYHFFRPLQDAKQQVELFLKNVVIEPGDLPPALDLEVVGNLKNATFIQRVEIWVSEVENRTGIKPIIYSGFSFLNTYFTIAAGGPPLWAKDHMLWIANYLAPDVTQPNLPTGWKTWTFWQHSSSGKVNGISSSVDFNWFNGTLEELYELVGKETIPGVVSYTVKSGDTLMMIADNYQVLLKDLVRANPQLLQPGMTLNIPKTGTGSGGSGESVPTVYIVLPGDTLTGIAIKFNTTVEALVQANNIANPDLIQVGQQLIIPEN
jgi:GH25 family lysozyme M1 (1,4-beta-N-acetylmuramidase)